MCKRYFFFFFFTERTQAGFLESSAVVVVAQTRRHFVGIRNFASKQAGRIFLVCFFFRPRRAVRNLAKLEGKKGKKGLVALVHDGD